MEESVPWDLLDVEVAIDNNKTGDNSYLFIYEEVRIILCGTTSEAIPSNDEDLLLSSEEAAIFVEGQETK